MNTSSDTQLALGEIDRSDPRPIGGYEYVHMHTDVAVVGGGPAGLSAALEVAGAGAKVILIDDGSSLGGHLRWRVGSHETGKSLSDEVRRNESITVLRGATAFGHYEDLLLGISQGHRSIKLRPRRIIVATGSIQQPLIFHNNDLPGVLLGDGVRRLMHLYGVTPGRKALVVSSNDDGPALSEDLLNAGVHVEALIDSRPNLPDSEAVDRLKTRGSGS